MRGEVPSEGGGVGVVEARVVLRLGVDRIAVDAAAAVVVDLRVARHLVEARVVEEVVHVVHR